MTILLCPGQNGDGRAWFDQPGWHALAEAGGAKLEGLNYRSPENELTPESRKGYYYPESGSHGRLIREMSKKHGADFRLALFGYSGGAHFAHRFVHAYPERVAVWCAYSAGWWDEPPTPKLKSGNEKGKNVSDYFFPPGLILCGADDPRRAASADYFLACRRNGLPVCWAEIPNSGHEVTDSGRQLAQRFMLGVIRLREKGRGAPVPLNATTTDHAGVVVMLRMPKDNPTPVAVWLPDEETVRLWKTVTRAEVVETTPTPVTSH